MKPRTYAIFISALGTFAHYGAIAVLMGSIGFSDFFRFIPESSTFVFLILSAGALTGLTLYLGIRSVFFKKNTKFLLLASIVWMSLAFFFSQISILFALFLPWALFKVHREALA